LHGSTPLSEQGPRAARRLQLDSHLINPAGEHERRAAVLGTLVAPLAKIGHCAQVDLGPSGGSGPAAVIVCSETGGSNAKDGCCRRWGGPAYRGGAAAQVRERVREKDTTRTTTTTVRKVSAIIGTKVSLKSDSLGTVKDIVISEDGCIDYLIVDDREEYVAVPWGAVRYDVSEKTIIVTSTVTRDRLKAVRFRSSSWP